MKTVGEKKYLGQIISNDMKNEKNPKDETNRSIGNVTKIITTLNERPFGAFTFKAAKLMRDGILISSLLNNSETWINLTHKNDLELRNLTKCCKKYFLKLNRPKYSTTWSLAFYLQDMF